MKNEQSSKGKISLWFQIITFREFTKDKLFITSIEINIKFKFNDNKKILEYSFKQWIFAVREILASVKEL
jgi:hypothetical protein